MFLCSFNWKYNLTGYNITSSMFKTEHCFTKIELWKLNTNSFYIEHVSCVSYGMLSYLLAYCVMCHYGYIKSTIGLF